MARQNAPGRAAAEFSEAVKSALAAEAGYRCANPSCLAPTHAAGSTQLGEGKVGQAAHISAAAEGFARWRPKLDPAVRKSAANGIWLCNMHAREIDVDDERFPESLLHGWKRRARQRAHAARGLQSEPPEPRALIRHTAWLGEETDRPALHSFVANFMNDTGAQWLWSGDAHDAIRMTLYELVLNAVEHGDADRIHLRARGYRIDLAYVGANYNPNDLSFESGDGGAEAMLHLRSTLGDSLTVAYTHNGTVATVRLIDVASAGPSQPCAIRTSGLGEGWEVPFSACETVHVFVGGLMSFSDLSSLGTHLGEAASRKRLVVHGLSEPLAESVSRRFPEITVAKRREATIN